MAFLGAFLKAKAAASPRASKKICSLYLSTDEQIEMNAYFLLHAAQYCILHCLGSATQK
jgi:hypothetical protein